MIIEKEVPNGWIESALGEIAEKITKGSTPTTYGYSYQKEGIRFIKVENVVNGRIDLETIKDFISEDANQNQKRSILKAGDVLFSIAGTIGEIAIVEDAHLPANTNQAFAIISGFSEILTPAFLEFQLKSFVAHAAKAKARGGAMFNISLGDIKELKAVIAPLNEQRRIVDRIEQLFSDLDEGEALLKTVQKQLATYRQSVLKAAVTGELTKEWRKKNKKNLETGEKLLARILESRRKNWKGRGKYEEALGPNISLLPPLPNGWTWATLPQLGEFGRGKSKHRPRNDPKLYTDGKYPFLQTGAVRASRGRIKEYDTMYNDFGLKQSKLWPVGTVCITIAANIAESGILEMDACFPDSVVGLIPHSVIYGEYIEFFIRTARDNLERYAPATAQKNINLDILGKVGVPLPSTDEQKEVIDRVSQIFSQIDAFEALCEAELKRSTTLRQSILKSAFSGKLVAQDPADEPASELLARIKSGDNSTKAKDIAPRRGRKPSSDKSEAA